MFPTVTAKLDTMRKAQEFIVQPMSDGNVMIQSDKRIGTFDPITGEGRLSTKGSTFIDLHPVRGSKRITFPAEFVAACLAVMPRPGGTTDLAGGVVRVVNTVQVVGDSGPGWASEAGDL